MTGLLRDSTHMYSWNDGPKVPGVTSVMKMLDKSGPLVGWAKRETAACAVRNLDMLAQMVTNGGPESAIRWLKDIPGYQRDKAADLGTSVHAIAEAIARGDDPAITELERPFIESYRRDFLERYQPTFKQVEFMVYSERHLYGGTADVACVIDGELWLLDYKTSKNVYSETALQLAALRNGDFLGRPGDPTKYAVPQARRFGVVHVRPEAAQLIEYRVTKEDFEAFLACRQLYGWVNERAEKVRAAA